MMKLLILDSWRLSTKISESGCWISRHGERRWQELFFGGNKSYQTLPLKKSWALTRVRINQFQPSFVTLNSFGTQLLLLGLMVSSSLTPQIRVIVIWKQIEILYSFFFFGLLRDSSLNWYYGSFVFHFLRTFLFWIMKKSSFLDSKFSCFFEMSFLDVVLNVKLLMLYS